MTAISTFANPEFGQIRAIKSESGGPLFVASDVARILGYFRPADAISAHCKGVAILPTPTAGGTQNVKYIPESDLYRLIMKSKMPKAEQFQDWVMEEVLPSIRKTGGYMLTKEDESPEDVMARAVMIAQETLQRRELRIKVLESENSLQSTLLDEQVKIIEEQKPKALFADAVSASPDCILVRELAKILCQNGIETGEKRLYEWLRQNGYVIAKEGKDKNTPTQRSSEMGLLIYRESAHVNSKGESIVTKTTYVTTKGQQYFVNKFLSKKAE